MPHPSTDSRAYVLLGKKSEKLYINGRLTFTPHPGHKPNKYSPSRVDGTYKTIAGPSYAHAGVIYAADDQGMSLALTRLTKRRLEDVPYEHQRLLHAQEQFLTSHKDFFENLREKYAPHLEMLDTIEEAELHHADPHTKRPLRIVGYADAVDSGIIGGPTWTRRQYIKYKIKKAETAKYGKLPRAIGDAGVEASLAGFISTLRLKEAMSKEDIYVNGGQMHFCKAPIRSELEDCFEKLYNPPLRYYALIFSDDWCLSMRINGKIYRFNGDISGCDASHGPKLFEMLELVCEGNANCLESIKKVVNQARLPIKVQSYSWKKESVKIKFDYARLYSGLTITTAINNLAVFSIILAISELKFNPNWKYTPLSITHRVENASLQSGYICTVDYCEDIAEIMFLKNRPVRDINSKLVPVLAIGTFMRSSGCCYGDYPGRATEGLKNRASAFQAALLAGMFPRIDNPYINRLKAAVKDYAVGKKTQRVIDVRLGKLLDYKIQGRNEEVYRFTDEELFKAYKLTPREIDELSLAADNGYGQHCGLVSAGKILTIDYSLSMQHTPNYF